MISFLLFTQRCQPPPPPLPLLRIYYLLKRFTEHVFHRPLRSAELQTLSLTSSGSQSYYTVIEYKRKASASVCLSVRIQNILLQASEVRRRVADDVQWASGFRRIATSVWVRVRRGTMERARRNREEPGRENSKKEPVEQKIKESPNREQCENHYGKRMGNNRGSVKGKVRTRNEVRCTNKGRSSIGVGPV